MKILVVGHNDHFEECKEKLAGHDLIHTTAHIEAAQLMNEAGVIFDFLISERPGSFAIYQQKKVTVFLNSWKVSLGQLVHRAQGNVKCLIFGFNGFPTMFNREFLEVSVFDPDNMSLLKEVCANLGSEYRVVDDRVGLVTPRVICMIINEAYFAVQDGTASREDIDIAMKLGTNYPYGPFEWCRRVGLKYVYELLDAVYQDTRDERYKISALMKKEYLALHP